MVVIVPVPSAMAGAMMDTKAHTDADIAHMDADANAVSDMSSGADAADMGACADIAVIGMAAGPDGPGLTTRIHLGVGGSGGKQSERKDGRNQRFHDDFLRRAERGSPCCPLTTHERPKERRWRGGSRCRSAAAPT